MPPTHTSSAPKENEGAPSARLTLPQFGALGSFAGTFVVGLLTLVGVTGPVLSALSLALLIGTFLASSVKVLQEPWRHASRPRRTAYVAGVTSATALLLVVAFAAREAAPLPTMPGTRDVAVVGYLAPSEAAQDEYDDLADSLAAALPTGEDGEARNYAAVAGAPLQDLRVEGRSDELDEWVEEFQRETRAELVVAGRAEQSAPGQVAVQTLVYVPARMVYDAAELVGWYVLDDSLLDRSLTSAETRSRFVDHVTEEFAGLSAFLTGLDAWQAGNAARAVEALDDVIGQADDASALRDLALLFRGHAKETLATGQSGGERAALLAEARRDYASIRTDSPLDRRAELSAATNSYLLAVEGGCEEEDLAGLAASSDALATVAAAADVPELARRKAQVNRAQVEACRLEAGEESVAAELDPLLAELTAMEVPENDEAGELLGQVKALALSIQSVRLSESGRLNEAVEELGQALALEPRFERQALWRALRSAWLLHSCLLDDGRAEQAESLRQLDAAVQAGRQPSGLPSAYASAFAKDLEQAHTNCAGTRSEGER